MCVCDENDETVIFFPIIFSPRLEEIVCMLMAMSEEERGVIFLYVRDVHTETEKTFELRNYHTKRTAACIASFNNELFSFSPLSRS